MSFISHHSTFSIGDFIPFALVVSVYIISNYIYIISNIYTRGFIGRIPYMTGRVVFYID